MTMTRLAAFLAALAIAASPSLADTRPRSEKPAQPPRPAPVDRLQTCSMGGGTFTGVLVPGTSVCTRVGGFVRFQAGGGSRAGAFRQ